MPWFITSICSQETMEKLREKLLPRIYLPNKQRTFGFYNTYNEAYEAVKTNRGNMEECIYDYIVMEYIEPGIHPMVHSTQWWKWDIENNTWKFLADNETPKEFNGICNWALG